MGRNNQNQKPQVVQKQEQQSVTLTQTQSISVSPIPLPEDLQKYHEINPEIVQKIMDMTLKEQEFRHKLNLGVVKSATMSNRLGQIFALLLGVSGLGASVLLGYVGAYWASAIIGGGTTIGLVSQMLKPPKNNKNLDTPKI